MAVRKLYKIAIGDNSYEIPSASDTDKGLMSNTDFTKLKGIESKAQENTITGIKVNGTALTLTSKVADILIGEGTTNGTISVNNIDKAVHGLAAMAYKSEISKTELATALKNEIEGKLDASNTEYTTLKSQVSTLVGTGAGSIDKKISDAFDSFVKEVTNDNVVNSFKELVDWVATHGSEAAEMAQSISTIEGYLTGIGGENQPANVLAAIDAAVQTGGTNVYTKTEIDTALSKKVDKVSGKGLSTNDYTTTEKTKLSNISEYANKTTYSYDSTTGTLTISGIAAA